MSSKYKFYEVVTVNTDRKLLAEINGLEGAVLGMVENDMGQWSYSVSILKT